MNNLFRFALIILALLVVVGIGYTAFADISVPSQEIEKKIPNEQFFAQQ